MKKTKLTARQGRMYKELLIMCIKLRIPYEATQAIAYHLWSSGKINYLKFCQLCSIFVRDTSTTHRLWMVDKFPNKMTYVHQKFRCDISKIEKIAMGTYKKSYDKPFYVVINGALTYSPFKTDQKLFL